MSEEKLYEPVRDEALREIAHSGKTYTHEAKSMAHELIRLRKKFQIQNAEYESIDWSSLTP